MGRPTLPESAGKTAACHKKAPTDILCFEVPVPSEIVIIQKEQHMEIYGTLGPACHSKEILTGMFRAGMTGMRLNLSHTALRESSPLIDTFRAAAEEAGVIPKLLIDMQGPELRVYSAQSGRVHRSCWMTGRSFLWRRGPVEIICRLPS